MMAVFKSLGNIGHNKGQLLKDSFWAVFGNAIGKGLLLLAGIAVARFLGRDSYGEYGLIRNTILTIGIFSTFGIGYTATKFISQGMAKFPDRILLIYHILIKITLIASIVISALIFTFARQLAVFLENAPLATAIRMCAIIIVFNALTFTQNAILCGFKEFKKVAINNGWSGIVTFVSSASLHVSQLWIIDEDKSQEIMVDISENNLVEKINKYMIEHPDENYDVVIGGAKSKKTQYYMNDGEREAEYYTSLDTTGIQPAYLAINGKVLLNGTHKSLKKYKVSWYMSERCLYERNGSSGGREFTDYKKLKKNIIKVKKVDNEVINKVSYKKYTVSMKKSDAYNLIYDKDVMDEKNLSGTVDVQILVDKSTNFIYEIDYVIDNLNSDSNNKIKYSVQINNFDFNNNNEINLPF